MSTVQRINHKEAGYLLRDPQYLIVALLRFKPSTRGQGKVAEWLSERADNLITAGDAHPVVAALRQRIRTVPGGFGRPFREEDPGFDICNHVSAVVQGSPIRLEEIGQLMVAAMCRPLDVDRPLWRVEVVERFEDDSFGLLMTMHDAFADGVSGTMAVGMVSLGFETAESDWDEESTPVREETVLAHRSGWIPEPPESSWRTLGVALRERALSGPALLRRAVGIAKCQNLSSITATVARYAAYLHDAPPVTTRSPRVYTWASRRQWNLHRYAFPLFDLRLGSHALSVTINDLLLAAVAMAWPSVVPDASSVWVSVPVNLRGEGQTTWGNVISDLLVNVPCGEDALTTLRTAARRTAQAKETGQARTLAELSEVRARLPRAWQGMRWGRTDRADVALSNMAGNTLPVSCRGAPLVEAAGASSLSRAVLEETHPD